MLLPEDSPVPVHEGELVPQEGYFTSVQAMLGSLAPDQVVLDIGAGNRRTEDARVVRMDVLWTPHVEVLGDALALPFRDESFDFVLASAVWEHLSDPFRAAREVWRVLKPGGQVGVDCNFVFPYHGYPAVYFNCSGDGLRQVFAGFREVAVGVAPWQGPSYMLEAVLSEYVRGLRPSAPLEHEFVAALQDLARFPLRDFDRRFTQQAALRISAGVSYLGLKQPRGDESTLPPPVLDLWRRDQALQARYPDPGVLLGSVTSERNDTLLAWARGEGSRRHPEIDAWFASRTPFRR